MCAEIEVVAIKLPEPCCSKFCVQGGSGRINDLSLEQWRKIQSVNYDSVFYAMKVRAHLVERDVDNVRRDRGRRDKASGTLLLKDGTTLFCVQGGSGRINDLSLEQWRKIQSVNYDSVFYAPGRAGR
jgi:hypothetical protein